MDFCSFFAGIGGFELGMQRAGHTRAWACEIDPFARAVYGARFGAPPEASDINAVRPGDIPDADVWVGGFPCQDLSQAGKRAGIKEGTRSGLVWKLLDLAEAREPAWLLLENVPGLLSSQKGEDFRALLSRLDELGYVGAWRVLDARFFGVPQRRRRVFIVARRLGAPGPTPLQVLVEPKGVRGDAPPRGEAGPEAPGSAPNGGGGSSVEGRTDRLIPFDMAQATHPENRSRFDPESPSPTRAWGNRVYVARTFSPEIANTIQASAGHHGRSSPRGDGSDNLVAVVVTPDGQDVSPTLLAADPVRREGANGKRQDGMRTDRLPVVLQESSVRRLTPRECERLQGFPDDWTLIPWKKGEPASDSLRYKAVGNAVAVPVIEWIARRFERS